MRIKIIGDNNCARATRHLLRLAGFAVTEFLPADAVMHGPHAGYAITIDLAPATQTPDSLLRPDCPTHHHTSASEEAPRSHRDASSPTSASTGAGSAAISSAEAAQAVASSREADSPAVAPVHLRSGGGIHFDSVDSALEAAVLRHVAQLAAAPVIVDRPGGVVHSDRELRIVAPNTGDAKADEAAAVAIEFGVLRGLLDLTSPAFVRQEAWRTKAGKSALGLNTAGKAAPGSNSAGRSLLPGDEADESAEAPQSESHTNSRSAGKKSWWPFGIVLLAALCGAGVSTAILRPAHSAKTAGGTPAPRLGSARLLRAAAGPEFAAMLRLGEAEPAQGQFATGQGIKITDGNNFWVVDPCKAQVKLYASISQTANTQLVAGTASKKIYVCSIHVVAAAAANVAVVEGTGSVCGTSAAGVSGFGGATAATGWNFAANGGIALGNGDSSLGAEGTGGDNLCIFNSGSGQVSGGISYVVQ